MEVCTWHCSLWSEFPAEVAKGEFHFMSHLTGTVLSSSMCFFPKKTQQLTAVKTV